MKTGYYSPDLRQTKGVHVAYWNDIAVRYGNKNPNDVANFTLEAFLSACSDYLYHCAFHGSKSFIQLPINQVWSVTDWEPATWLADIVSTFKDHPALAGWYLADEPEVWGYSEPGPDGVPINANPKLTHSFLYDRYRKCKQLAPDVPVLVVFCDLALYDKAYSGKPPFYDIFGFDYYPFTDHKGHALRWDRFTEWRKRSRNHPVMYVAQGCGRSAGWTDENGEFKRFGQLDMTAGQFDEQYIRAVDEFGNQLKYYLLWDWHYADENMRVLGKEHLIRIEYDTITFRPSRASGRRVSILRSICNYIRRLLR